MEAKIQNFPSMKELTDKFNELNFLPTENACASKKNKTKMLRDILPIHNKSMYDNKNIDHKQNILLRLTTDLVPKEQIHLRNKECTRRSHKKAVVRKEACLEEKSLSIINAYLLNETNEKGEKKIISNIYTDCTKENKNEDVLKDDTTSILIRNQNPDAKKRIELKHISINCVNLTAKHEKQIFKIIERGKRVVICDNHGSTSSNSVLHKTRNVSLLSGGQVISNHGLSNNHKTSTNSFEKFTNVAMLEYIRYLSNNLEYARSGNSEYGGSAIGNSEAYSTFVSDDNCNHMIQSPASVESGYNSSNFDGHSSPSVPPFDDSSQSQVFPLPVKDSTEYLNESLLSYQRCTDVVSYSTNIQTSNVQIDGPFTDAINPIPNNDQHFSDSCINSNSLVNSDSFDVLEDSTFFSGNSEENSNGIQISDESLKDIADDLINFFKSPDNNESSECYVCPFDLEPFDEVSSSNDKMSEPIINQSSLRSISPDLESSDFTYQPENVQTQSKELDERIKDDDELTIISVNKNLQQEIRDSNKSNVNLPTNTKAPSMPLNNRYFQVITLPPPLILNVVLPLTFAPVVNLPSVPAYRNILPRPEKKTLKDTPDTNKKNKGLSLKDKLEEPVRKEIAGLIYKDIDKEKGCIFVVHQSTNSTCLHLAVKGNKPNKLEIIYCLVTIHWQYKVDKREAKRDINIRDVDGKTARDYAAEAKDDAITEFLSQFAN